MNYRISGLPPQLFKTFLAIAETELTALNVRRVIAEDSSGYPCRVSLQDARQGESLLLLPFEHHPVASPYRASGPIYVRENAEKTAVFANSIPPFLERRLLSVRGYDEDGWMHAAEVVEGKSLDITIRAMFDRTQIAYLHVHNARPGCYACRVERG